MKTAQTNKAGEFDFEYSVPGLYFIGIKHPNDPSTELVAVTVTPQAPADHLDLDIAWTSCGLSYVDQSNCPRNTITTARLSGNLADESGASIANGYIYLIDSDGKIAEELRTANNGNFASPLTATGIYRLIADLPGFAPLRATIKFDPSASEAPLKLHLSPFTGCSTVSP